MPAWPSSFRFDAARDALMATANGRAPSRGTNFSRAFLEIEKVAGKNKDEQVMVVFLSDGRPGDMRLPRANAAIPQFYKVHKQLQQSFAQPITRMLAVNFKNFDLRFVGIHESGYAWLQRMAKDFDGTFHAATRSVQDDDDDEIECLGVKSPAEDAAERLKRAQDQNQVVDLVTPQNNIFASAFSTMAPPPPLRLNNAPQQSSSLRTTFQTLGSALTSMRAASSLSERPVELAPLSAFKQFYATKMVLKDNAFVVDNASNVRIVELSAKPFAQGGLRNVYVRK